VKTLLGAFVRAKKLDTFTFSNDLTATVTNTKIGHNENRWEKYANLYSRVREKTYIPVFRAGKNI
jgi:hypothetical protein